MVEPSFWRQQDLVVPSDLPAISVVGAGGIGSFAILALTKMGVSHLSVFDDDLVEDHNLPNQIFGPETLGMTKVSAIGELCKQLSGVAPFTHEERFTGQDIEGVVVSGVDSMESRKEIWQAIKGKPSVPFYVEARMGAEVSRIHSVNPSDADDIKWYEETLYDDGEALELPCTARAIIYNGFAIGALIASQIKKWSKHEELCREIIFDLRTLTLLTQ